MKKLSTLLLVLLLAFMSLSLAQEARRIVILPFTTTDTASPYAAGMAVALQRTLNVIDNVFVPPIGDSLAVAERLLAADRLTPAALAEAFAASVVISGNVEGAGAEARVRVGLSGPSFAEPQDVNITGPLENAPALIERVVNTVIDALALPVSAQDRGQVNALLAQTPSFPSLSAVAISSLRTELPDRASLEAAAQLDAGSSWVLSEQARALALGGELDRAQRLAQQATAQNAYDIEAWLTYGSIMLTAGEMSTAQVAFERALSLNASHALALAGQGQMLSSTDPARATQLLQQALTVYPRLVAAYLQLATLQRETSPQQAVRTLRSGAERVPESAVLHDAVVQEVIRSDGDAAALTYLRQALAQSPESPPGVYALASRIAGEAQQAGVLALIAQGRARYPDSAMLAVAESMAYEQQGNFEAARTSLQQALAQTPNDPELSNRLAILLAREGRLDEARAAFEASAGDDVNMQINLAQVYIQAGQSRAAVELLDTLTQRAPNDPQVWTLYGIALGRAGRYNQALTALDQAISLDPGNDDVRRARNIVEQARSVTQGQEVEVSPAASAPFETGQAALQQGNYALAASEFSRARTQEDAGLIAFYHAYALQLGGDPRQAISAYERALQDYPGNSIILNNLGFAYHQIGRYDRALQHIQEAIAADANNAQAHMNLGITYFNLNRYGDAIGAWERAIALDSNLQASLTDLLETARRRAN